MVLKSVVSKFFAKWLMGDFPTIIIRQFWVFKLVLSAPSQKSL